jgi:two-component system cell cycle response regulator
LSIFCCGIQPVVKRIDIGSGYQTAEDGGQIMRVAVVDPSRTVAKCLTRLLEPHNHEVISFTDGIEALDHIKADEFIDVLIASAELLSMSGPELCWQTRLLARSGRPLYIILMSSNDDRGNLIKALDSGADDFITKPPRAEELCARLRAADRVVSSQRELFRAVTTDFLTGVLSRRAFFAKAGELFAGLKPGRVLSAIMLDIDYFKRINDTYGHDGGDAVLNALGEAVYRECTTIGRLGGEEFAMLLEDTALPDAIETAERLRRKFEAVKVASSERRITFTCSFGVSEWQPNDTIDHLLKRADIALYAAKEAGRNRVVSSDDPGVTDYSDETSIVRSPKSAR